MSDRAPDGRGARKPAADRGIVALAVGLGFVLFVIMRGFNAPAVATWMVASAVGIAVFVVVQAARRRRS